MSQEEASIHDLDDYIQIFYEDKVEPKIAAARKILLLTMDLKNIQIMSNHDSLLQTISRILHEEFQKSTELSIYLLCIFFIYSNYNQFHNILIQNQLGDATLKILEYQIGRFDLRYAEFMELDQKNQDYDKELQKLNLMIAKQDKLFYIALTILLNLAEDFNIERKMKKRKMVTFLVRMLERNDFHLLIVSLIFLRKMSIVGENKTQMLEDGIVDKLGRFFTCGNNILLQLALGVLKNLCFDKGIREAVNTAGYIPKIVDLMKMPNFRFVGIVLLYLMSLDDKSRFTFAYTECMSLVIKLIVHFPEQQVGKELISLAINLAANQRTAQLLSEEEVQIVLDRAQKHGDNFLYKFLKNVAWYAQTPQIQSVFEENLSTFIKIALTKGKNDDLKFEIIGILANIPLGEKWRDVLKNNSFIDFIHNNLAYGIADQDIILETVMLVSNITVDAKCAEILAKSQMMTTICTLIIEKGDDDEFIVQLLFALYQFLVHKIGIEFILQQEEIVITLLNNIQDQNLNVRKINDEVLDILREYDPELSQRVKERKFYEHNREWIESMLEYEKSMGIEYNDMQGMDDYQHFAGYQEYEGEELDPKMWDSDNQN